jgi:hypothetical protein
MNYSPFNESQGTSNKLAHNINDRINSISGDQEVEADIDDIEVDVEDMRQTRIEMLEFYRKNKNLNYYLYMYDDPEWHKNIEEMTREFYEILREETEGKKNSAEEEKLEEQANIQIPASKNNSFNNNRNKNRKMTEGLNSSIRKQSDNQIIRERKLRNNIFEKDCLDLDDLVKAELPEEYNFEKHEELMYTLGEDLMNSRKIAMSAMKEKRADYLMKNDDFNLLLCLLRKKKESVVEKNHYYVDYNITLDDVYRNDRDEIYGVDEKKQVDIESFVKKYIDSELNN